MYVEVVPNRNSRPAVLLREGWREQGRIRKRTLANLSDWADARIEALRAVLKGLTLDDRVIVNGLMLLRPDVKVVVQSPEAKAQHETAAAQTDKPQAKP
jgi:hypothetical protein